MMRKRSFRSTARQEKHSQAFSGNCILPDATTETSVFQKVLSIARLAHPGLSIAVQITVLDPLLIREVSKPSTQCATFRQIANGRKRRKDQWRHAVHLTSSRDLTGLKYPMHAHAIHSQLCCPANRPRAAVFLRRTPNHSNPFPHQLSSSLISLHTEKFWMTVDITTLCDGETRPLFRVNSSSQISVSSGNIQQLINFCFCGLGGNVCQCRSIFN